MKILGEMVNDVIRDIRIGDYLSGNLKIQKILKEILFTFVMVHVKKDNGLNINDLKTQYKYVPNLEMEKIHELIKKKILILINLGKTVKIIILICI